MPSVMIHDSIDAVLADRQHDHGEFSDTARTSQHIKQAMREGKNWAILSDTQKDALEMVAVKIGRLLSGDPNHADHWDDVTGYTRLISRTLHRKQAVLDELNVKRTPFETAGVGKSEMVTQKGKE